MEIHNKLIYIHFPKTAGQFITEKLFKHDEVNILKSIKNKSVDPMNHFKYNDIIDDIQSHHIIFTVIRNPYTWYVSYYFHHLYYEKTVDYWKNLDDSTIKINFKEWIVNNKNLYSNMIKEFFPFLEKTVFIKFETLDKMNDLFQKHNIGINLNFQDECSDIYSDHCLFQNVYNNSLKKFKDINFIDNDILKIINNEDYIFTQFNYNKREETI